VAPELKKEKRLRSYNILLLAAAFLIVALVLYAYFGYLSTTIACLLQIPLSYVLPALLLALLELPLSIPTLSGFLLLTGVSVNNGIVLFGGGDSGSALLSADCDPLLDFAHKEHPLLLSALTTAAGVLPTALTGLGTAGVLAPLSIVVASGTAGSYLFLYLQCGLVLAWSDRRSSPPVPPFGRSDRRGRGRGCGYGHAGA
jgi:multidrug efflux pump subunit AcrB